jgi:hypothetical protein
MRRTDRLATWRRAGVALLVAAGTALAALPGAATAQDVPGDNSGPRFAEWGPGHAAPSGAQQVAPMQAAPPGAAAPGMTAPPPGGVGMPSPSWGGCNHNLAGSWAASGEETRPTAFLYDGNVSVLQYGSYLQATETGNTGQTQYYGRCQGNALQFDVYSNGQFIGYQNGTVGPGGRWGAIRISFNWVSWMPNYAAGTEHWRRAFY